MKQGLCVLLIDADPQCNATQAILEDDVCEDIYVSPTTTYKTLYSCLKPLELGEPSIDDDVIPILASTNRFLTDIIPGHPKMSIIEDRLSDAWSDLQGRDIRGYRITNWCAGLLAAIESRYDLVVFDVGPSLGALNRSVILASDYIVTPFGCYIFSLLGIENISSWIKNWKNQYDRSDVQVTASNQRPHYALVLSGAQNPYALRDWQEAYNIRVLEYGLSHDSLISEMSNLVEAVESIWAAQQPV